MVLEHSLSFKQWELEENKLRIGVSFKTHSLDADYFGSVTSPKPFMSPPVLISPRPMNELDVAAVKLQKVYKSYRTRRSLADCAVVAEELWWKALDFAKPETAASRWARAGTKAAKVGKGLSKDAKAQKLALRHWLEAIDPRHRYGHNLHQYYDVWFKTESTQPFFYWLDVGDGKEVNLQECPRNVLQSQCVKYLGPKEREAYEVIVMSGKLVYRKGQLPLDTIDGSKWIFVLCTSRNLYVGQKKKGEFQHSSFLSGGATSAAGRLVVKDGILKAIWPYSGHYHPTEENFKEFISFLEENNVDLASVQMSPIDDDKCPAFRKLNDEPAVEVDYSEDVAEDYIKTDRDDTRTETDMPGVRESPKLEDHKDNMAFEFTKSLSCKWSSGAGPRIGCVRDYPTDLQSMALEQVNLSPRLIPSPGGNKVPIPSQRPSPGLRLSPRVASMGIPTPRVCLTLPANKRR